jgi:hypothetical protein
MVGNGQCRHITIITRFFQFTTNNYRPTTLTIIQIKSTKSNIQKNTFFFSFFTRQLATRPQTQNPTNKNTQNREVKKIAPFVNSCGLMLVLKQTHFS